MADMISRAAAVRALASSNGDYLDALERLEKIPAVDDASVIRCRDCKYGEPTKNARGEAAIKCEEICRLCRLPRLMAPDWFCADGERRDDKCQG